MVNSMTAFASIDGSSENMSWAWELRSVNGRGLDLKIRLPDGFEYLEPIARKQIPEVCKRGSIVLGLKLKRTTTAKQAQVNFEGLQNALEAALIVSQEAKKVGLEVAALDIGQVLSLPDVYGATETAQTNNTNNHAALEQDLKKLVKSFAKARAEEGAALARILSDQLNQIEALHAQAIAALQARGDHMAEMLQVNVARVLDNTQGVDEARFAQELALIAVKADVTEELDRLGAHITGARELLAADGPIGRKFDFLTQEFNREANTLCSKANFTTLTRIGLDVKTVIDQMREQVQNVE